MPYLQKSVEVSLSVAERNVGHMQTIAVDRWQPLMTRKQTDDLSACKKTRHIASGPDLAGGGPGTQLTWGH